jgi:DNA-binding phage protein
MTYIPSEKQEDFDADFYKDKQRVFNYVLDRIVEQAQPSMMEDTGCAYLGKNGGKCAAGQIIPLVSITYIQNNYGSNNGLNFAGLIDNLTRAKAAGTLPFHLDDYEEVVEDDESFLAFVSDMQDAHDNPGYANSLHFQKAYIHGMDKVAKKYNLSREGVIYHAHSLGFKFPLYDADED